MCQFIQTLKPLELKHLKNLNGTRQVKQSSPAGSLDLANLFPLQGNKKGKEMTAISGRKCYELYGRYSHLGLLVKMFLESSEWNSKIFVLRWKVKAMKSSRLLFHLRASEHGIKETGSGSLLTLTATERWCKDETEIVMTKNGTARRKYKNGRTSNLGVSSQIERSIPTLKAQSANSPGKHGQGGMDVQTALMSLSIKTLQASDGKTAYVGNNRKGKQTNFTTDLREMTGGKETGLKLHPNFAEIMQGYPIGWTE
jgi:hypothetical protein